MEIVADVPDEKGEGRLGFNVGAGVEIRLSDKLALVGDVRVYRFDTVTLRWTRLRKNRFLISCPAPLLIP